MGRGAQLNDLPILLRPRLSRPIVENETQVTVCKHTAMTGST